MATETSIIDSVRELERDEFRSFVAAVWRRADWRVRGGDPDDPLFVERATVRPEERLLHVFAPAGGVVSADEMRDAVARWQQTDATGATAVTPYGYEADALAVADAHGVDAVGPEALSRIVTAVDGESLLED